MLRLGQTIIDFGSSFPSKMSESGTNCFHLAFRYRRRHVFGLCLRVGTVARVNYEITLGLSFQSHYQPATLVSSVTCNSSDTPYTSAYFVSSCLLVCRVMSHIYCPCHPNLTAE